MALHCPFGHLKHKLWSKEKSGIKLTIRRPTIKSQESTRFPCVQATCDILLESSWWGLQLCFRFHCNWRFAHQGFCPQSRGSPNYGNFLVVGLGSPGTKSHLNVALVESYKVYYQGESGGFTQVRAVVNLVSLNCSWFVLAPKVFQLCINHFVLVLCRFVWISEACQFFLVPSWSSNMPFYPFKCCGLGNGPNSLFFCYF
jgi:hypothetical protein